MLTRSRAGDGGVRAATPTREILRTTGCTHAVPVLLVLRCSLPFLFDEIFNLLFVPYRQHIFLAEKIKKLGPGSEAELDQSRLSIHFDQKLEEGQSIDPGQRGMARTLSVAAHGASMNESAPPRDTLKLRGNKRRSKPSGSSTSLASGSRSRTTSSNQEAGTNVGTYSRRFHAVTSRSPSPEGEGEACL